MCAQFLVVFRVDVVSTIAIYWIPTISPSFLNQDRVSGRHGPIRRRLVYGEISGYIPGMAEYPPVVPVFGHLPTFLSSFPFESPASCSLATTDKQTIAVSAGFVAGCSPPCTRGEFVAGCSRWMDAVAYYCT